MTRRRMLLVAVVGLAVLAGLWAYAGWRQYRLERQLVGTWAIKQPWFGRQDMMELLPDGELRGSVIVPPSSRAPAYWSISGQELVISYQPQRLHHALWPLARLFGWRPTGLGIYRYELTGGYLTVFVPAYLDHVWTRVPEPSR